MISTQDINELLNIETLTRENTTELKQQVLSSIENRKQFDKKIETLKTHLKNETDSIKSKDLKFLLGICKWIIGEIQEAVELLKETKTRKTGSYYLGKCYQELGFYEKALECFERAKKSDTEDFELSMDIVDTKRKVGDVSHALKIIKEFLHSHENSAELHYQWGHCLEDQGKYKEAINQYEQAIQIEPDHTKSLFRIAFNYDLEGDDDSAIEYYEKCTNTLPPFRNAFINLGVLYEDKGRYDDAIFCYESVLDAEPTNERAELYLKNAKASLDMYFDEEFSKKQGHENEVLNIPISDFELSVRSRNCLEKMNIHTLKDLTKITEPDLLTFKNFGETSLNEIKSILSQKGLQLGQSAESTKEEKSHGKKKDASRNSGD